nr:unnamed protein product [Spirometra erinaceieuropaei]
MSPLNPTQYARAVDEHSARRSASSVIFGPDAVTTNTASTTVPTPNPTSTTTASTLSTVAPDPRAALPSDIVTYIITVTINAATTNTTTSTYPVTSRNVPDVLSTTNAFTITLTSSDVDSTPTSPFLESSDASDVEEIMDMEGWPSEEIPTAEIQSSSVETHDIGQDNVRTSDVAERISNIADEALADVAQWRPRSLHNSVRDKGGVSSTSQKNSVITVTGGLVQIETAEQAAILGLPRGKYRMRLPPDFEKSHRTPPPTSSRMGFSSSTSHQPTSPLPADITGSEVCVSNRSPAGGVGRSTPTTPLPLPSGSYLSTEPTTAENARLLSESFAPTTPPTVDHPLTSSQPIPQIDTASPATSRRSTVFKHRFCLLPGLKKPLEIPLSKADKTDSTLPTNSQSAPFVPPDALTPLVLEFEEPSFGGVMASGPIDPPLSPSQSTSEQYTAVSEPSAWDPPTSDLASHPATQVLSADNTIDDTDRCSGAAADDDDDDGGDDDDDDNDGYD